MFFYNYNPTKSIYGKNILFLIQKEIPKGANILILTTKNLNRRYKIKDRLKKFIKNKIAVFDECVPNSKYSQNVSALNFARKKKINFIISFGGGSVHDTAKFVSLFFYQPISPWSNLINDRFLKFKKTLDIGCIGTYPAAGSETNNAFVVLNEKVKIKNVFLHLKLFPRFAIFDTIFHKSLTEQQIQVGYADILSHALEHYITSSNLNDFQKRECENILISSIHNLKKLLKKPKEDNLILNSFWNASRATSGSLSRNFAVSDWSSHFLGHYLTAIYGVPHGIATFLFMTKVFRYSLKKRKFRLEELSKKVFNKRSNAIESIGLLELFISKVLNININFDYYKIKKTYLFEHIKKDFKNRNIKVIGHDSKNLLSIKDIKNIINEYC